MNKHSITLSSNQTTIAVVIPCYRVKNHILDVIAAVPNNVTSIFVVDDCCPENTGDFLSNNCFDPRLIILYNPKNLGVGGAMITGYRAAINAKAEIIVKIDGDGQMDPNLIGKIAEPIIAGEADYVKGNRFYDLEHIRSMPRIRLLGNAVLSFMTKFSSGYWNIFDPTNGFTAIHSRVASRLPFNKISQRYFFETDMLFRLNTLRAVVVDVPVEARYGDEKSNLKISRITGEFLFKHIRNFAKRIFYNYYLRDMALASLELPLGAALLLLGIFLGIYHWVNSAQIGAITPPGTVMLAVTPILLGLQLVMAFLAYDISNIPRRPLHKSLYFSHTDSNSIAD